jgi:hypothetical protein
MLSDRRDQRRPQASGGIVGVDFGAPRRVHDQRRKIIAIEAQPAGWRRYRIDAGGLNARLLDRAPPGWAANELLDELLVRPRRIVAFDFPFCVPDALLRDEPFAAAAGYQHGAFRGWRAFNAFVADRLPLADPLDFRAFEAWRDPVDRARLWSRRATDQAAGGQPPLKDRFQATFQMTLVGNVLLARLWESQRYRVLPFAGGRGPGEIIEVFPGATLRHTGLRRYKSQPQEALRLGIAACTAVGVALDVDARILALCCRYSSGGNTPDHDAADAFVALCTAILHAEGACRMAIGPGIRRPVPDGAIWVPSLATREGTIHGRAAADDDQRKSTADRGANPARKWQDGTERKR